MQRKYVIAGNWKMNKTHLEAQAFVAQLEADALQEQAVETIICAPFTALTTLQEALRGSAIHLGAQNLYPEAAGAYTGEISPPMLTACGCRYVIIGHSERREYFQESDVLVNQKVKLALEFGLNPILCVGETLSERREGRFEAKILTQLELGLSGVQLLPSSMPRLIIAYEPIWAIGTGETCDEKEANRILGLIRAKLTKLYSADAAQQIRLLYGGSVKPETMPSQIRQSEIDGALVGGASLKPDSFSQLVLACRDAP